MNWQTITVYAIIAVCGILVGLYVRKFFTKEQSNGSKCSGCSCDCSQRNNSNSNCGEVNK